MEADAAVFYAELGRTIGRLRKRCDLTQVKLAAELGVSQPTVTRWERGIGRPNAWHVKELGRVLGVEIGEITDSAWEARNDYVVDIDNAIPTPGELIAALESTPKGE